MHGALPSLQSTPRHTQIISPTAAPRRRSVATFEEELGVRAPERLRACAGRLLEACDAGTMLEASEWLANATSRWRAA